MTYINVMGYNYTAPLVVSSYKIDPVYVNAIVRGLKKTIRHTNMPSTELDSGVDFNALPYCIEQSRVFAVTVQELVDEVKRQPPDVTYVTAVNTGLPFKYCMVVPSKPIPVDVRLGRYQSVAYLLVEGDLGCVSLEFDPERGDGVSTSLLEERHFIKALTNLIKLPQSMSVLTPGQRYAWKAAAKSKVLPTPYYVVDWKKTRKTLSRAPSPVEENNEETQDDVHRLLKYRHDRSAHRRLHVRRTMGVFDAIKRECLVKRGFVIYEPFDILGPVSAGHLVRRGHPLKKFGETVALRVSDVRQTIVGKPDLPYIPAVRAVATQDRPYGSLGL